MELCVFCIYLTYCMQYDLCENLPYESVYFKELHNEQECYCLTIYRVVAAVVSTITSLIVIKNFEASVTSYVYEIRPKIRGPFDGC